MSCKFDKYLGYIRENDITEDVVKVDSSGKIPPSLIPEDKNTEIPEETTLYNLTDASATTNNYSYIYHHAPTAASIYILPDVTDNTITHAIILNILFTGYSRSISDDSGSAYAWKDTKGNILYTSTDSPTAGTTEAYTDTALTTAAGIIALYDSEHNAISLVASVAFQDTASNTIVPINDPPIVPGTIVRYICDWSMLAKEWTIMPVVLKSYLIPPPVISRSTVEEIPVNGDTATAMNFDIAQAAGITVSDGGSCTYDIYTGTLPAGLSMSPAGVITGTPTASSTATVLVRVNYPRATPLIVELAFTIVNPAPAITVITSSTTVNGNANAAITPLDVTGFVSVSDGGTPTFSSSNLPSGISISGGMISGTPTAQGQTTSTVNVSYTNAYGTATASFTVVFDIAAPTITYYYTVSNAPNLKKMNLDSDIEDTDVSVNGNYSLYSGTHGTSSAVYTNGTIYMQLDPREGGGWNLLLAPVGDWESEMGPDFIGFYMGSTGATPSAGTWNAANGTPFIPGSADWMYVAAAGSTATVSAYNA